jgi:hypothetical protein
LTSGTPDYDKIPDVRDGLTREERVVLYVLHETQKERGDRNVPTAMVWGRVCEYFYTTLAPQRASALQNNKSHDHGSHGANWRYEEVRKSLYSASAVAHEVHRYIRHERRYTSRCRDHCSYNAQPPDHAQSTATPKSL